MLTIISASEAQQEALLNKHLKAQPFTFLGKLFGSKNPSSIVSSKFSWNSEDSIGFVTLYLATGKKVQYQLRGDKPCFATFSGFTSDITYEISYPTGEMFDILQKEGIKIKNSFWAGGSI